MLKTMASGSDSDDYSSIMAEFGALSKEIQAVNECSQMDVGLKTYESEEKDTCLKVNGVYYTDDLNKLLKKLEENPCMVIACSTDGVKHFTWKVWTVKWIYFIMK